MICFLLILVTYFKNNVRKMNKQLVILLCFWAIGESVLAAGGPGNSRDRGSLSTACGPGKPVELLPERISQYEADVDGLNKVYIFKDSPEYYERMRTYNKAALASLQELNFESLSTSDQVDYLLLQRNIRHSLQELEDRKSVV